MSFHNERNLIEHRSIVWSVSYLGIYYFDLVSREFVTSLTAVVDEV